ncbi:MAG: oxidoreductase [Rhodospirillaceae bacterium]|nr:oxidoreductase [Rhodospirillaceae bacterium]|tara:strand:- start:485 stop:1480 length:996 start_codon:yes stop_codon:yes gene_type:complete
MADGFRALVLDEAEKGVSASIQELTDDQLPEGDVTVSVSHSTLNYKDGMILKGIGRLVRNYPHVPGVDFAGTVEASESSEYKTGDKVVLTGWRVGEVHWGGYAQKARVKSDWLVPLPDSMTEQRAMAIGTAGFTAMLAVMELEAHGVTPDSGPVLVTGGNGGVGGVAIGILSGLGYEVHTSTGRPQLADHLKAIGASEIVAREELDVVPERPLASERWAGAIDAVGGNTLASILPQLKYRGAIAACGLAGGADLNSTVIPFLLRGVKLLGIDSVMCPFELRKTAWNRLATELSTESLDAITEIVSLEDLLDLAGKILKGETQGRVVVDLNA